MERVVLRLPSVNFPPMWVWVHHHSQKLTPFDFYLPAWGLTQGHSVLPKSKTASRIKANMDGDIKLSSGDMKKIESLDKGVRFNDSSKDFGYEFFTGLDGK
jgi:diketogulonate reductase-like aldo/keto reductase